MKHVFLLLGATIGVFLSSGYAQVGGKSDNIYSKSKVYISIDKPVRGQANEDKTIFIDVDKGSYAYVIVDNYPEKFPGKTIKLTSFKKLGGKYEKIKSENFDIDNSFTYTYIKYSFTSVGEFAFDVHDGDGTFINSGFVKVESNKNNKSTGSSDNFSSSKAFISVETPVAGIAKESKSIVISRDGGYAYIVLDNYPNNLKVSQIKLKAYRKIDGKYEKLDDKLYDINADKFFTYIQYSFYNAGEFAFDIYTGDNQFINTAYVTVEFK